MSRVGKNPVPIPKGVSISIQGSTITVKGPKGSLSWELPANINAQVRGDSVVVERIDETRRSRALHGLARALVNNMVRGVSEGFSKVLELHGLGYRASVQGKVLNLSLGYSHPIEFRLPEGIKASVDQNKIRIEGIDKELVGRTAARIVALRKCEPYKGKGIRYEGQEIRRKAGKSGAKK